MQAQARSDYRRYALNIGETVVSKPPGEIVCYGLGSCLGLFLYDKFRKVGAGAHIWLPGNGKECESDEMLEVILKGMLDQGCFQETIRARLVGGAKIMNLPSGRIGQRNIEYVKKELRKRGIIICGEDTGGAHSRTARMDIESGTLSVNDSKRNFYTI